MLLFDMDGTLIDSNGIWKDVDTRFLEKRGACPSSTRRTALPTTRR